MPPLEPYTYVPPTRDLVALNSFAMHVEQQDEPRDALLHWRDTVNVACHHPELAQESAPPSEPSIPAGPDSQEHAPKQEPHLCTPLPAPLDDELMDLSASRKRGRDEKIGDEDSTLPRKQITSSTPSQVQPELPASRPEPHEENDVLLHHQGESTTTSTSQDHVSVLYEAAAFPPSTQGAECSQPLSQTSPPKDHMEFAAGASERRCPSSPTSGSGRSGAPAAWCTLSSVRVAICDVTFPTVAKEYGAWCRVGIRRSLESCGEQLPVYHHWRQWQSDGERAAVGLT
ncbi:hypothetical protein HPB50_009877 [Hyalomma asiaticum]|uniref:Uncharacterized protein n=1 Tax=Hyalomma asiaticum TaxID=266040 RepID=A0ACB7RT30_HYAAI|nr:hypothetical protein HPB50_009877 [Hyalomma asiaticum]